ncbi:hypothetical protein LIA77_04453 [Sarocladium implicatum]|nr:hypothetical protein LIA77_04453 [Sarocladium implicatum]
MKASHSSARRDGIVDEPVDLFERFDLFTVAAGVMSHFVVARLSLIPKVVDRLVLLSVRLASSNPRPPSTVDHEKSNIPATLVGSLRGITGIYFSSRMNSEGNK